MSYELNPEIGANAFGERINLLVLGVFALATLLDAVGVFALDLRLLLLGLAVEAVAVVPTVVLSRLTGRRAPWLRYLHIGTSFVGPCATIAIDSYSYTIAFAVPLGLTCCYLNRKLLWDMALATPVLMVVATGVNATCGSVSPSMVSLPCDTVIPWRPDLWNVFAEIGFDRFDYFLNQLRYEFLPTILCFYLAVILADGAIRSGRQRAQAAEAFSKGLLDTLGPERAK